MHFKLCCTAVAYRVQTPPPEIPKALRNRAKLNPIVKTIKNSEFRTPTPQDVRKKGSKILKLPPVRNCFTLAMTNKLVVIINSLKVPKIKKILLYEMKFLVPIYSCLQNHWLWGYRPQIPVLSVLRPQLNLLTPPSVEQSSLVRHCCTVQTVAAVLSQWPLLTMILFFACLLVFERKSEF